MVTIEVKTKSSMSNTSEINVITDKYDKKQNGYNILKPRRKIGTNPAWTLICSMSSRTRILFCNMQATPTGHNPMNKVHC